MTEVFAQLIIHFDKLLKPSFPQYGDFKKLYKKKDFTEEAVATLYANFKDGMIEEYLKNMHEQNIVFPIVSNTLLN
jgi:hypothetical protein